MTKAVEKELIDRHMQALGLWYRDGRHEETPEYNGKEDGIPGGDEGEEECADECAEGEMIAPRTQAKLLPLTSKPGLWHRDAIAGCSPTQSGKPSSSQPQQVAISR